MPGLTKKSFSLSGHRTSVALEPEFWAALTAMAAQRATTLAGLIISIDASRAPATPLASALRLAALRDAQESARRAEKM